MFTNSVLLSALIFVTAGFLVGVLVMILFGDRSKNKETDAADSPDMENLIMPETPTLPEERFESIVHIYRERQSGKLVIDVNDKVHLTSHTIPTDLLGKLEETSHNWQAWLGLTPPAPVPVPVATPTPAAPVPQPDEPKPPVTVGSAVRSAPVEKPRARTMVGQIEEVLQEMLPDSEYAGQNIHLGEEPGNGVVVWVGAQKYVGIDSVPDEGIKTLIQSAVRRWEATAGAV